ncbi:hypothetical protein ACFL04_01640 [Patescibacteria group bacterium]
MTNDNNELSLAADKLILSDPTYSRRTIHAEISTPSAKDERILGRLFFVLEIENTNDDNTTLFHDFQTSITNAYYRNREGSIELSFERAVQEGNNIIRRHLTEINKDIINNFNGLVAVIHENELHLTSVGNINAFLSRGSRIMEIIDHPESEKVNPVKFFSHLVSGEVQVGDRILFSTASILDYLSQEKIRQIISGTTTANAIFTLESLLKDSLHQSSFAAIIVGLQTGQQLARPQPTSPAKPLMAQSSIDELNAKSRYTSELLRPSVRPKIREWLANTGSSVASFARTRLLRKPPKRRLEQVGQPIQGDALQSHRDRRTKLLIIFKKFFQIVYQGIVGTFQVIVRIFRRPKSVKERIEELPVSTSDQINKSVLSFNRLNRTQKRLLLSVLILIFIFSISVVWRGASQEGKLSDEQKVNLQNTIEDKLFTASSAITYGDEAGAIALLDEVATLVEDYPDRNKEDSNQRQSWLATINSEREKTKHITTIESPQIISDLTAAQISTPIQDMVYQDGNIFTANNDMLIMVSPEGTLETFDIPEHEGAISQLSSIGLNIVLLLTDQGQIIEYNTIAKDFDTYDVPFANQDRLITDFSTYENRVYFLDTKNNQIFRHPRGAAGYGDGSAWLSDADFSVSEAQAIMVDGNVYVINRQGIITELFQGQAQDFSLSIVDPALEHSSAFWTDVGSNFIYLLDPVGNRLVIFTKSGTLKDQYVSPAFNGVQSLAVAEENSNVYILNGSTIYLVDLNQ